MDRHLVGIVLLAVCLVLVAVAVLRIRHNSPRNVYRRSRQADEARWAARAGETPEEVRPAD
jgi:hypothetical protein